MERRFYQRVPLQVSAIVTTEEGVRIKVATADISSHGLGIECNTKQRNMITPGGSFVRGGKPIAVFVDLHLSDTSKIIARCQVVFSRRMSNNHCKIGLRYTEIENKVYERLVHFIEKSATNLSRDSFKLVAGNAKPQLGECSRRAGAQRSRLFVVCPGLNW